MSEDDLVPIISRANPFFTDHAWDKASKTETARMDTKRLVVIKQKACIRHHMMFTMHIEASEVENNDRFWVSEMLVMVRRVFFDNPDFLEYKKPFEQTFIQQFQANGVGNMFNFPLGERTFICKISFGEWGAKVQLEMVKFIILENIKRPGIARSQDDAWYKGKD